MPLEPFRPIEVAQVLRELGLLFQNAGQIGMPLAGQGAGDFLRLVEHRPGTGVIGRAAGQGAEVEQGPERIQPALTQNFLADRHGALGRRQRRGEAPLCGLFERLPRQGLGLFESSALCWIEARIAST